ncbi:hypothetical protein ABW20_dc0101020 [Dactylellina cionopaga]|nr:hypothetical protein ABW20_dc0101020 [Dactylellina cionopaga]
MDNGISPNATQNEIRKAYKVQALKTHPGIYSHTHFQACEDIEGRANVHIFYKDRVPVDHPDRPERTRQFQQVNDAYYTLSDPVRKRDYDATRAYQRPSGRGSSGAGTGRPSGGQWQDEQFGEFFEEMMNEEGLRNEVREGTGKFWAIIGALAGAILGYIIYNSTGLLAGLVLGNRLGAVRDRRGKSVYEVFQEMPQSEKFRILSELAAKVLSGAMSS